ncbi:hypothetical protein Q1695_002933 [Nippostrongylus brasiliensis]|nr:hypothetical protein Q1695_002933 [Nippostrongylus brasiliensis]
MHSSVDGSYGAKIIEKIAAQAGFELTSQAHGGVISSEIVHDQRSQWILLASSNRISLVFEMLRIVLGSMLISSCLAVTCYDCYDTGPDHTACTKERSCEGLACMIFEAGDENNTMTAFCLLALKDDKIEHKAGCWMGADGQERHCMCFTDYCNRLEKKTPGTFDDPQHVLLPNAQFLKSNPLVDFQQEHFNEDSEETDGVVPLPGNLQFPNAYTADPRISGNDDDDLVPIDFAEYDKEWHEKNDNISTTASSARPPSLVLMTMTLATSLARLFAHL